MKDKVGFDKTLSAYKVVWKKEITERIPGRKLEPNHVKKIVE